jgi:hypothetical protein
VVIACIQAKFRIAIVLMINQDDNAGEMDTAMVAIYVPKTRGASRSR